MVWGEEALESQNFWTVLAHTIGRKKACTMGGLVSKETEPVTSLPLGMKRGRSVLEAR